MVSSLIDLMLLWFFLAAAVAMVILTVRSKRLEQEEGLPRSTYRLPAAVAVCTAAAILVVLGSVSIVRPPTKAAKSDEARVKKEPKAAQPQERPKPTEQDDPELAALERQQEELRKQMAAIEARIKARKKTPAETPDDETPNKKDKDAAKTAETEAPAGFDYREMARVLVPIVVLIGVGLLLFLGDPRSLVAALTRMRRDRSQLQHSALDGLNALTAAANEGRYKDGLARADAMDFNLLEPFDRMDAVFLKSYCAVQLAAGAGVPDDQRRPLLEASARALSTLLEEAPNRGEAVYLLALAQGLIGESESAIDAFHKAKELLPKLELPFDNNESVCLLDLAERKLSEGNADAAGQLFDRVTKLKVLGDQIPTSLLKVRLLTVRRALQANELTEATRGLDVLRKLEGLNQEQRQNLDAICDALQALISVRGGDDMLVARQVSEFLDKHMPASLPTPDEGIADEYLDTPLSGIELRLAPEIYRAFLFLKAEVAARIASRIGGVPTTAQVNEISQSLLRALQFQLRQRDVLAALGGLYFFFVPEKKKKAIEWLTAAVDLGVDSRIARRILERSRQIETENKDVLDWFRQTAVRFLHDPTVQTQVRQALVEELGRFQGFEPLLLELDPKLDQETREPTLTLLRDRAAYMEKMVADLAAKRGDAMTPQLEQLRKDYARLIGSVDASTQQMTDIERKLMQEIGKTVLA